MPIDLLVLDFVRAVAWPTTTIIVSLLVRATILALFVRATVSTLAIIYIEHTSKEGQSDAPCS